MAESTIAAYPPPPDAADSPASARWLARVDRVIGGAVEAIAAVLLAIEIVLLLAGVIARYVFHNPLVWSDELASVLFLWLAMLGAVLALRREGNMRMTALRSRTSGGVRHCLDLASGLGCFLLLALILMPAVDYALEEQVVSLSTMEGSMLWRAAAMPVGVALMLVSMVLSGRRRPALADALVFGGVVLLVCAAAFAGPFLRGLGHLNLLIFFVGVAGAAVLAGIPIAFSFGLATLGYLALSTPIPLTILIARMDAGMAHPILLSIPLFVFLGLLIEMTGMAAAMVTFLANLLGHVKGGLSYVLVGAMYLVSGISGSKAADMAAVAPVLFPEMEKRGIPRGDLVALLAATGAQTETIPPSLILITIGSVTGMSIAALFNGGLLPGVVGAFFLCTVIWYRSRRDGAARVLARATGGAIRKSFVVSLPALALPFVIRFSIVEGIATATEVATIGIAYSVVIGLAIYRRFDWRRIWPMLVQTATLSGAILLIVGTATSMAWAITQSGISRGLAQAIIGLPGGATTFLAVSALIFIVLGSVLEGIPAIVLMGPLLFPVAHQVGINDIHYAMVAVFSMGIGLFSPPFGVGYYVSCAIGGATPDEGLPFIGRYILALVAALVTIAAIPWISTAFL
jgi:tripartite ATP-independent transporter DctM subunit